MTIGGDMKKSLIFLTLFSGYILFLTSCGGGGNSLPSITPTVSQGSNLFVGTYNLRDENHCEDLSIIDSFLIRPFEDFSAVPLVVLSDNEMFPRGSTFIGDQYFSDDREWIRFNLNGVSCVGAIVLSSQEKSNASENGGLSVEIGDLINVCNASANVTGCITTYQRQNSN